jgi:hypothetical protein
MTKRRSSEEKDEGALDKPKDRAEEVAGSLTGDEEKKAEERALERRPCA